MVVGGLPNSCADHAEKVANMACSMLDAVTQVHSPVDSQPIKVGLATFGILQVHRYASCLFFAVHPT